MQVVSSLMLGTDMAKTIKTPRKSANIPINVLGQSDSNHKSYLIHKYHFVASSDWPSCCRVVEVAPQNCNGQWYFCFGFVKCLNRNSNTVSPFFPPSMQPRVCCLQWSDFADRMCQLPLAQVPQLDRHRGRMRKGLSDSSIFYCWTVMDCSILNCYKMTSNNSPTTKWSVYTNPSGKVGRTLTSLPAIYQCLWILSKKRIVEDMMIWWPTRLHGASRNLDDTKNAWEPWTWLQKPRYI